MKKKEISFFWLSFTDLMTSLFFIMLVLFVISTVFSSIKDKRIEELEGKLTVSEEQLKFLQSVDKNLEPLKKDSLFFKYEPEFKRFTLAFDVNFKVGLVNINSSDLVNAEETISKINNAGYQLKEIIESLKSKRENDTAYKNVSYLLIISGYASDLKSNKSDKEEYERSYRRAYNLWNHWKYKEIDFESGNLRDMIDLQIAGNGLGGLGRFPKLENDQEKSEMRNQRFIIQIVPKIGDTEIQ